jgi:hypothetical protein
VFYYQKLLLQPIFRESALMTSCPFTGEALRNQRRWPSFVHQNT